MSFYAFSPLGGGFLTGSVKRDVSALLAFVNVSYLIMLQSQAEKGSRFDANHAQGAMFIKVRFHYSFKNEINSLT